MLAGVASLALSLPCQLGQPLWFKVPWFAMLAGAASGFKFTVSPGVASILLSSMVYRVSWDSLSGLKFHGLPC